jgi:hypothetical protein
MQKLQMPLTRGRTRAQFGALQEVLVLLKNRFTYHFNNDSTIRWNTMKIKHKICTIHRI